MIKLNWRRILRSFLLIASSLLIPDLHAQFTTNPLQAENPAIYQQNLNWNYNMGYRFTANSDGNVTQLGGRWADGVVHTVRLYAYPSGTLLASANVTGSTNWSYTTLLTPVAITSGNDYVVAVRLNSQSSGLYSDMALPVSTGGVTIVSSVYRFASNNMPNASTLTTMYGQADITFEPCVYAGDITAAKNNFAPGDSTTLTLANNVGSIQWQFSTDGITFQSLPGQTKSTLATGPLQSTTFYRTYVSNNGCVSDTSEAFAVKVVDPFLPLQIQSPGVTNQEVNWNYNMGYRFTALKNGSVTHLGGKWKDGIVHTVRLYSYPAGTVLATLNVTGSMNWNYAQLPTSINLTAGSQYVVAVRLDGQSSGCSANFDTPVTSNGIEIERSVFRSNSNAMPNFSSTTTMYGMADLRFVPCSFAGTLVANETSVLRNDSTTLNVVGNTTSIQWQSSTDGITYTSISGATDTVLNSGALAVTTYFRTITTVTGCGLDTSAALKINVIDPDYPLQATKVEVTSTEHNYNYNMGYRFTALSNGSVTELGGRWADGVVHTVRLYAYPAGTLLATTNVSGTDDWNYATLGTPVSLTAGNQYVVAVRLNSQNSGVRSLMATPVTSGQVRIDASVYRNNSNAMPNTTSTNTMYGQADLKFEACVYSGILLNNTPEICPGDSGTITTIEYTGGIQWQSSADKNTWTSVAGANSPTINSGALLNTTYYRVITSAACGSDTSLIDSIVVTGSSGGTAGLWTALENNDWNNACNWSDGNVPTNGSNVTIPNGVASPINIPAISLASLRLENTDGIDLSATLSITDTLTLINGAIRLNNANMEIAALAIIIGGFSTSYIHTNGNGTLRKLYNVANSTPITLPIGGSNYYAPVTLRVNAGTVVGPGAYVSVRTIDNSHPLLTGTSAYLNRYWTLSSNALTNPDYSIDFQYNDADTTGAESSLIGVGYNSGWTKYNAVNTGSNSFSVANINALGDFSAANDIIYVSHQTGNWNDGSSWEGGIAPSSPNESAQILATHTITAAGNESVNTLTVENGGTINVTGTLNINGDLNVNGFISGNGTLNFNGTANQTIAGSSLSFPSVTINNSTGVTITGANHLLSGTLTLTAGAFNTNNALTLVSNASGTARVAPITGGSISGDVTVQRYIDAGNTNWRFIGSPITNGTLAGWNDDFITSGFPGSDFPAFPFVSIYRYDETALGPYSVGYTAPNNITDALNVGEGYWVWSGDTSTGTQPFTIELTGPLNTGNINLPVSYTNDPGQPASQDGWNMVSNPYASTIDWDAAAWTKSNLNNAIYIWDPDNQQYASYVAGIGVNGGSRYIASSQAFWVQSNATSPTLTATENVKSATNQAFLRNRRIDPMISIRLTGNGFEDQTVIRFNPTASKNFDEKLDARKLYSSHLLTPALSSSLNGETLSINSIDSIASDLTLPLNTKVGKTNSHTFHFKPMVSPETYSCVIFEDRELGVFITLNHDTLYTCTISDTAKSTRFWLHFGAPIQQTVTAVQCHGDNNGKVVLQGNGTGPWNYSWHNDQGQTIKSTTSLQGPDSLTQLSGGNYKVIISNNGVCGQSEFAFYIPEPDAVVADFNADSIVDFNRSPQVRFSNRSINTLNYHWDFGDGNVSTAEHPNHRYAQTGQYTVLLSVSGVNDCTDSTQKTIQVIDKSTGLVTNAAKKDPLHCYPNPNTGNQLHFNKKVSGRLYSSSGQLVFTFTTSRSINLNKLESGIYLLETTEGEQLRVMITQ